MPEGPTTQLLSERGTRWLLIVVLVAQLFLIAAQVQTPGGGSTPSRRAAASRRESQTSSAYSATGPSMMPAIPMLKAHISLIRKVAPIQSTTSCQARLYLP